MIGIAIAGFLGAQNLNYVIAETYLKDLLATHFLNSPDR